MNIIAALLEIEYAERLKVIAAFLLLLSSIAFALPILPALASGGTMTNYTNGSNTFYVHTFTGNGTFNVSGGSGTIDILIVAGGGGGGGDVGGGGGAGGLLYNGSYSVNASSYTVTVGYGGVGYNTTSLRGQQGGASSFWGMSATGGGGGGANTNASAGGTGGSGGGGSGTGAPASGGAGISGQGNNGGNAYGSGGEYGSGGGGGAGATGANGNSTNGGSGGTGLTYDMTGASVCYAGGGGGSTIDGSGIAGVGACGGGNASVATGATGLDATNGTGSGGGGGANNGGNPTKGGNGGSGIIIIRYALNTSSTSPTINSVAIYNNTAATGNNLYNNTQILGFVNATTSNGSMNVTYKWYVNGTANYTGTFTSLPNSTLVNIANVSAADIHVGANWTLQVNVTDA